MSLQKLIINSTEYNKWVNQKYVDWLSAKPEALLHQEVASSYPSIIKTLDHIWGTQEFWWSVTAETSDFVNRYGVTELDATEIFKGIMANCDKLVNYVTTLSEADLLQNVKLETQWFSCDFSKYEYIQHLIMHGAYHRGQIVTIGRNVGITDAPMTDYNFYNVEKAAK